MKLQHLQLTEIGDKYPTLPRAVMHLYTLSDFIDERIRALRANTAWSSRVRDALTYLHSGLRSIIAALPPEAYLASLLDPRYFDTFIPIERREHWWNQLEQLVNIQPVVMEEVLREDAEVVAPSQPQVRSTRSSARPAPDPVHPDDLLQARFAARGATQATMKPYRDLVLIKGDPADWWRQHESIYPAYAKLAKKYLAIPASSAPCERLFSVAGNVLTKRRASLSPDSTRSIVFVHEHIDLLDLIDLEVVHFDIA